MTLFKKGFLSLVVLFTPLIAHSNDANNSLDNRSLTLTDCHVKGVKQQIRCGTLKVPENYQKPNGPQIELNVAVMPAIDDSDELEPLMFLAGGPGQAAVDLAGNIRVMFNEVRKTRDIIMVDQRGTGKSAPLECPEVELPDPYTTLAEDFDINDIHQCLQQLQGDLSQFNSENAVRDFDQVRKALGHQQINLYGGSYGTRAALVYMRLFPDSLRSVVLDSVGPVEVPVGVFGQSGARSFNLMLENCENDQVCSKAYPNIRDEFKQLITRLEQGAITLDIIHPRLGTKTQLAMSKPKFTSYIRMMLYSPNMHSMIPLIIHQTYLENYAPITGFIAATSDGMGVNEAVLMNIVCNEDFPRVSEQDWAKDAQNDLDGDWSHFAFKTICPVWPKYSVGEEFYQPVTANIPTLILSGNMDPVTPPSNGDYSDKSLPNSRHIVDDKSAHIVTGSKCAGLMLREFYDNKDPKAVDESCLADNPKTSFVPSLNGGHKL